MGSVRYSMDVQAIADWDNNASICERNARRAAASGGDSVLIAGSYMLFTCLFFFSMSYLEESVLIRASENASEERRFCCSMARSNAPSGRTLEKSEIPQ